MATLARGLWLPLHSRLIEDGPGYLCFAGASLWVLRQRAEMLIDACETRHLSEARMRTPKDWTLLTGEIRPWDASHCRFPQEHMELACSGRNHLWLTVTSKAGDVELHTTAFSLDDLIEAIALWRANEEDLFYLGSQQLDSASIEEIQVRREEAELA
ncbi:hypothetical protein [Azotobacter salinestris]|uniref:hypothetical protein n=1 Tax=Azotobacter salinestris TaxID=69964 RepID=UPI0032DF41AB